MAIKTIETRAVISASDQTSTTFSAIAVKLKDMEGVAKRASETAGIVGGKFGALPMQVNAASKSITAMGAALAAVTVLGVDKLRELAKSVIETGVEFDKLARRQQAVLNISAGEEAPLLAQAQRLGGTTPYKQLEVIEAQTELAKRGIPNEGIRPIIEEAAKYGQAQGIGLPEAAKLLESAAFAEGKRGADQKELASIADRLVRASQISGMDAPAMEEALKGHEAETAGVRMPYLMAQLGAMHLAQIPDPGAASVRFASMLSKPTPSALAAMGAMGIKYGDYAKAGKMSAGDLSAEFEPILGRHLSASGLRNVQAILNNPAIAGDQEKLTKALTDSLQAAPKKHGGKPPDAAAIAKVIKKFWESSVESVDVEGLERALIKKGISSSQAVEIFGKRGGLAFEALSKHGADIDRFEKQIKETPKGLAGREAEKQMGGLAGAKIRAAGEWQNVLTKLFQDNEGVLTGLYNAETSLEKAFVDASPDVRHLAEAAAAAAASLVLIGGLHTGLKVIDKMGGGGTMFGAGAAGLGWLGGALTPAAPAIVAGMGAGLLAGSTPLNAGEDELARQRRLGIGGGRWLGNQPPEAGKFTPSPGGLGAFRLEGAASIGVRVDVGFDPGLLAKQITQTLDAGGNLRADTGVSMPRR